MSTQVFINLLFGIMSELQKTYLARIWCFSIISPLNDCGNLLTGLHVPFPFSSSYKMILGIPFLKVGWVDSDLLWLFCGSHTGSNAHVQGKPCHLALCAHSPRYLCPDQVPRVHFSIGKCYKLKRHDI